MNADTDTFALENPNKLFYRIREVAEIAGVRPHVLRYWESEFPELKPEKDGSDQRRYRRRDVETVLVIRKLLYEDGFTIRGAKGRLKSELRSARNTPPSGTPGGLERSPDADRAREGRREAAPRARTDAPSHKSIGFHLLPQTRARARSQALRRDLATLRSEVTDLLVMLEK